MALATLSIDLEARLQRLEEGLKQATGAVERNTSNMEASFGRLNKTAANVGQAIAGYFSARMFVDMVKGSIDAQDNL